MDSPHTLGSKPTRNHLKPLDQDETKEYIRFRLGRAGGQGIFTTSALDKLYEYTQGVPRRINAWCDLALVAGFAEGRHEIDGEFIDLVIAAQGGSLEGEEAPEAVTSEGLAASADTPPSTMKISHDGLEATVAELSARLTRLEGLVLEMTSQLVPALHNILESPASQVARSARQKTPPDEPREPVELSISTSSTRKHKKALDFKPHRIGGILDNVLENPSSQVLQPTEQKTPPDKPMGLLEAFLAEHPPRKPKKWWNRFFRTTS